VTILLVFLLGSGTGIACTLFSVRGVDRYRARRLRELCDWLGEDLEARKQAALRADQQLHASRGWMP
jgi:hypothetical protein